MFHDVQGGFELWSELDCLLGCHAEVQGPRDYVAVCDVPLRCRLQRRDART